MVLLDDSWLSLVTLRGCKAFAVPLPFQISPLLPESGAAKRFNHSTSLDSFQQKDDGYDNTAGQGRDRHMCQGSTGFVDPKFPKKVYKVVKALYGLHQAPRVWYATLSTFLLKSGYRRRNIDKTLFIKKDKNNIMLVQVYVDDIIFGSTKRYWCDEFKALMKSRFQMSSMGELAFFLGLQVKQKEDGIFIRQDKYVAETLKKFDFASVKTASTPIET
ncbi:putative ribonuclease H-like domain-containing protein [Tanacetum coccineum]